MVHPALPPHPYDLTLPWVQQPVIVADSSVVYTPQQFEKLVKDAAQALFDDQQKKEDGARKLIIGEVATLFGRTMRSTRTILKREKALAYPKDGTKHLYYLKSDMLAIKEKYTKPDGSWRFSRRKSAPSKQKTGGN